MNPWRTSHGKICLALLAASVACLGFACEPEADLRDPRCAKHPPPEVFEKISLRTLWSVYYDVPSEKCVIFDNPSPGAVEAAGAKDLEDFKERFTPFLSKEECMAVCNEVQPCDADNPCPPFEYPCNSPSCQTYPQTCVWVSSEGRGYCALQCQSQGLDVMLEHFGWSVGAVCPDGLTCSAVAPGDCYPCQTQAEACVVSE